MISTRTAAIRFGVSRSWPIKTAELGVFQTNFEVKIRQFFNNFFSQPAIVGAGVALSGVLLHRTLTHFVVEVFLQDARLLDWLATRPGFRLRRLRRLSRRSRLKRRRNFAKAQRARRTLFQGSSLQVRDVPGFHSSSSRYFTPARIRQLRSRVSRTSPRVRSYFYVRRYADKVYRYEQFFGQARTLSGSSLRDQVSRRAFLFNKKRRLIRKRRVAVFRRTFFRFRGRTRLDMVRFTGRRVHGDRPGIRRRRKTLRRLRRYRRRRHPKRRRRFFRRYWFIRHYVSLRRRYRRLPLSTLRRPLRSKFMRVWPRRRRRVNRRRARRQHLKLMISKGYRIMRRRFSKKTLFKRRRKARRRRMLRRQQRRRRRGSYRRNKRHRRNRRHKRRRRVKIFRRPTTRYKLKSVYRLPRFVRMRFFIFFARMASFLARRYFKVPVFFRLNFVGYVGTLDFYLNYITTKLYYRYILNDVIKPIVRLSAKYYRGFRIICNGRFTRAQMATSRVYRRGSLLSSMVTVPLAYGQRSVVLKYGTCNLKIWLRY